MAPAWIGLRDGCSSAFEADGRAPTRLLDLWGISERATSIIPFNYLSLRIFRPARQGRRGKFPDGSAGRKTGQDEKSDIHVR